MSFESVHAELRTADAYAGAPTERLWSGLPEFEIKFELPAAYVPLALGMLRAICRQDPLYPAATVTSVYFDTPSWAYLRQKINSEYEKTKIRLRWYGADFDAPDVRPAFAEAKMKIGATRQKVREALAMTGAECARMAMNDVRLCAMPLVLRRAGVSMSNDLRPVFEIAYRRHRFVDPTTGLRIALDTDIRAGRPGPSMLRSVRRQTLDSAVIELKGAGQPIEHLASRIRKVGGQRSAFSKYLRGYLALTGSAM